MFDNTERIRTLVEKLAQEDYTIVSIAGDGFEIAAHSMPIERLVSTIMAHEELTIKVEGVQVEGFILVQPMDDECFPECSSCLLEVIKRAEHDHAHM